MTKNASEKIISSPLWRPTKERIQRTRLHHFIQKLQEESRKDFPTYASLHDYSTSERAQFWSMVWDFCGIIGHKGNTISDGESSKPGFNERFFPEASLNFAENLLRKSSDETAIFFRREDTDEGQMSWRQLHHLTSRFQQWLEQQGIRSGDRVAALLPNAPEAVSAFLATSALGAIFASCSPDFGPRSVVDRFAQIEPKVLIVCDGYVYGGKSFPLMEKIQTIAEHLPSVQRILVLPFIGSSADLMLPSPLYEKLPEDYPNKSVHFKRMPFDHPLVILFSSGTTGMPKCIVHGAGGTLLQHVKEHQLHCDVHPGDRIFYFSTCSWMMWNWLVSALASQAALVLYDGSPFHPTHSVLFDYAQSTGCTLFGTSAKYLSLCAKYHLSPKETHDFSALRTITSTGSPLLGDGFDYVYQNIKENVHLASISGGTDILSCFVLGIPTEPVWRGEIQGPGLGMAVKIYDEHGNPSTGKPGELVCTHAFPSMPIYFWNDPNDAKYRAAYFEKFPQIWCHGDWAEATNHGGFIIHGRSDTLLKPGGVRIGTAEIYAQIETLPEIIESVVVGQPWQGDVRIILFIRLKEPHRLTEDLKKKITSAIRSGASPHHIPKKIIAVPDIPRTHSGKVSEVAVRDQIMGRTIGNRDALANPDSLRYFSEIAELNL
jgi:acetoacetyl-CoA synthetase